MKRIFAIGGGEIRKNETLPIDKEIVIAANKQQPKLLFIPTASGDSIGYIKSVERLYREKLGCIVETLYLINGYTSTEEARERILSSDIIYVGGGNTKRMLTVWEQYSVDKALIEAYNKGIIMSGLSAGSICWFDSGHSDSNTIETGQKSPYITVKGLGLIQGIHCPHYNEGDRLETFHKKVYDTFKTGIAIDDLCAIDFMDNRFKILRASQASKAYKIYRTGTNLIREELKNDQNYRSLTQLFGK